MIAKMKNEKNQITIPGFYDNVVDLSKEERDGKLDEIKNNCSDKIEALKSAGVSIASSPATIGEEMLKII